MSFVQLSMIYSVNIEIVDAGGNSLDCFSQFSFVTLLARIGKDYF